MKIETRKVGSITVLEATGKMTLGRGDAEFRETFKALVEQGARRFIFNLLKVQYIDSVSIGEIVACHKRIKDRDGVILLVLHDRLADMFNMYELQKLFKIFTDMEEALVSMPEGSEATTA